MTDYFNMMKDVSSAYGLGQAKRRAMDYEDEQRARQKTLADRQDAQYERDEGVRKTEDGIREQAMALQNGEVDAPAVAPSLANMRTTGRNAVADADALTSVSLDPSRPGTVVDAPSADPVRGLGHANNQAMKIDPTSPEGRSRMVGLGLSSAINKGDWGRQAELLKQKTDLDDEAIISKSMKSYTGSPEQAGAAAQYLNTKSGKISMTDPDEKGFVRMMVVKPDGKSEYLKLPKQDQATLFAAAQLMERNPSKALNMMAGVNKELASAFATENNLTEHLARNTNDVAYKGGLIDNKIKQLELSGQIAEAKALKAAAGGGQIGREERLRYTSLFTEAGRRVGESQRTLSTLQKDPVFMMNAKKAGTPEAQQLADLNSSIASHNEERSLYQGLLANGGGAVKPAGLKDGAPSAAPAPAKAPVKAANGDYSTLWK